VPKTKIITLIVNYAEMWRGKIIQAGLLEDPALIVSYYSGSICSLLKLMGDMRSLEKGLSQMVKSNSCG